MGRISLEVCLPGCNNWATWCEGQVEELELLVRLRQRTEPRLDFPGIGWEGFLGCSDADSLLHQAGLLDEAAITRMEKPLGLSVDWAGMR